MEGQQEVTYCKQLLTRGQRFGKCCGKPVCAQSKDRCLAHYRSQLDIQLYAKKVAEQVDEKEEFIVPAEVPLSQTWLTEDDHYDYASAPNSETEEYEDSLTEGEYRQLWLDMRRKVATQKNP